MRSYLTARCFGQCLSSPRKRGPIRRFVPVKELAQFQIASTRRMGPRFRGDVLPIILSTMLIAASAVVVTSFSFITPASAQTYPTRLVRILVPFPAGGAVDALTRLLAPKLQEAWGQPVIIDNRGGAGGTVGVGEAAKA